MGFPGGSEDKASAGNAGDPGSIPGLGRSPGEGDGNTLQYSSLKNPMERGAWRATVHGVTKSRTRLSDLHTHTHTHTHTHIHALYFQCSSYRDWQIICCSVLKSWYDLALGKEFTPLMKLIWIINLGQESWLYIQCCTQDWLKSM